MLAMLLSLEPSISIYHEYFFFSHQRGAEGIQCRNGLFHIVPNNLEFWSRRYDLYPLERTT